jgi:hypothetical protein
MEFPPGVSAVWTVGWPEQVCDSALTMSLELHTTGRTSKAYHFIAQSAGLSGTKYSRILTLLCLCRGVSSRRHFSLETAGWRFICTPEKSRLGLSRGETVMSVCLHHDVVTYGCTCSVNRALQNAELCIGYYSRQTPLILLIICWRWR